MLSDVRVWGLGLGLTLVTVFATTQEAQAQRAAAGPPDWPCVQRLIPELAWGTMWIGPSPEELGQKWWDDEEVGRVVRFATARETPRDAAIERVRSFVEQVANGPEEDREQRLTLLFAGLFERINQERSRTIERIRGATRNQVQRLERVSEMVDELEAKRASDGANANDIERLKKELHWEQRTFEMRQHALPVLCEKPYLLEEELSRMVRAIREEM
ncbi:hypothetical protein L861_20715 [Litchfieldella anticariensis FP35 = DSM 16096]|uniref:Uncharacterized protein n=1 Tax=Litchfieldella anticariensis (strain DSM 16096 / CECT 5854 / CIP 108499 / LMG 22089 / FP35) TaxID=1121939 RepID=S2L2X2_LITA3|nr:hypothetical protein [Halomonas anticariensis]EPC02079.1 hypothetical protein L861_20715 [Halomonas anticariensis FP35 = DSM 16096]